MNAHVKAVQAAGTSAEPVDHIGDVNEMVALAEQGRQTP